MSQMPNLPDRDLIREMALIICDEFGGHFITLDKVTIFFIELWDWEINEDDTFYYIENAIRKAGGVYDLNRNSYLIRTKPTQK